MVSKVIIVLVYYVNMYISCNSLIESLTISFKIYHLCNSAELVVCGDCGVLSHLFVCVPLAPCGMEFRVF